mgnify:CR=1 FL=1|jgi:acetyltransferase-like isoleucine patch superfamily enzyme
MLIKFWNLKIKGFPISMFIMIKVLFNKLIELINSYLWSFNLGKCGVNCVIQKGVTIRYPRNINFGHNISIGRNVEIFSECNTGKLIIGSNSNINKNTQIDFTGNLTIGDNVLISETSVIITHDHGYHPESKPIRKSLSIEDNVWIGQNVMILSNVRKIGKNAIIAAGSIVTKEVLSNTIIGGNPASLIKKIN